jgi:hypothetical protein
VATLCSALSGLNQRVATLRTIRKSSMNGSQT